MRVFQSYIQNEQGIKCYRKLEKDILETVDFKMFIRGGYPARMIYLCIKHYEYHFCEPEDKELQNICEKVLDMHYLHKDLLVGSAIKYSVCIITLSLALLARNRFKLSSTILDWGILFLN